ncbi:hypothetical protein N0V95_003011 [Ascochyta clinopodiicola]|nr:hypothetical protein N0V95_003011 [Ascochyta clinopodiicola]
MHMRFDALEYGTREQWQYNKINSSAHSYLERAVPFYQLTVALSDLSVLQTVLVEELDTGHEALVWNKTIHADRTLYASTNVEELDDFVAPNGLLGMATPEPKLKSQALRVEILDSAIDVVDIDEASTKIKELFATGNLERLSAVQYIASAQVLHLPESEEQSVAFLYDTILQHWIAPLAADIPIPVRQAKERLARRVATEVTLASARLRHKDDALRTPPDVGSSDTVSLPILPSKPGAVTSVGPAANLFPSSLPTPPQSSVPPSSQPPSSPTLPEFNMPPSTGDPLSRLRKYLTINNGSLTPTVIHPNVSELLSHWKSGSDPGLYDWEATEQTLRPEAPDEVSQELREKERKKRERREKRQRREDELMRAKSQTSSQAVFAQPSFPRSSPGPMFGGMGPSSQVPVPSSSQMPSQFQNQGGGFGGFGLIHNTVPQSQVEPGRFGGRPDKKKKKGKSRVSGF